MEGKKAVEALISGRVQGVCYRMETRRTANRIGVTGWVRNLPDGRVRAVFEGTSKRVDVMLQWCKKGPDMARVDDVEVSEVQASGDYEAFDIRY